jgi:hypothetical protein
LASEVQLLLQEDQLYGQNEGKESEA